MKKLVLTTALVIGTFQPLSATDPAAQQLLLTAKQQSSLFQDHASALQLDVDFVAQTNVPTTGHLTLKSEGGGRWWRKVVLNGFEQTEVRNGEMLYTNRNMTFTPIRVGELISLLQFAEGSAALVVKKQKRHVENGIRITCLQVEQANREGSAHLICLNSASHDILTDEWQEPPDKHCEEQYSDYFDFRGHRYPRKLQLAVNGSVVITATVQALTATVFDEALLIPPKGAIERRQCHGMRNPVPIETPDPAYPSSARKNKIMGDTTVAMTVLADGSVSDIRLIGTATHSLDDATLETLKGWKFKPAMCGSEPVVSDIEVVVSFRLR